jgi:CubicO group peptidase (beta-lactamase class C family)
MAQDALSEFVAATATRFGIPGVAVGVWADGREAYACHGVTSVDNPLPVDPDTLYVLGSVTKTYTATALLRLVADGRVQLEAPVRRYVPELRLADEQAAAKVTVLQLGGNGILLEHHVGRFVADAEAIYSYEGTREMNTLIVGRAITGLSAFV